VSFEVITTLSSPAGVFDVPHGSAQRRAREPRIQFYALRGRETRSGVRTTGLRKPTAD